MEKPIYFDNNATTPCDPQVVEAMLPYFTTVYGNAANKGYRQGLQADTALQLAREQVALLLGCSSKEIVFTASATEAINMAIKGTVEQYAYKGNHIITSKTEHKAVLETCKFLERKGIVVTYIDVDGYGQPNMQQLNDAVTERTILIALAYANNETGVIAPIKEISAIAKRKNVLLFTDATQAVGKIPVHVDELGVDMLAMSSHKLYGPKGIGALYVKPAVTLKPLIHGGAQENGLRSGTANVPGIVGIGKACELVAAYIMQESQRIIELRNKLQKAILKLPGTFLNGDAVNRLPNTLNIAFQYQEHSSLLQELTKEIAVASGSACSSDSLQPSHVLRAMGLGMLLAKSSIRFSLGRFTQEHEVEHAIHSIDKIINGLREQSPIWKLVNSGVNLPTEEWRHPNEG